MKTKEKIFRDAQYYVTVAQKVVEMGGLVQSDGLREAIREVEQTFGRVDLDSSYISRLEEKFLTVFSEVCAVEVVKRDKEDRGRGKRLNTKLIELKESNAEKLLEVCEKSIPLGQPRRQTQVVRTPTTLSKEEKARRDACVAKAIGLQEKNPSLTREEAIKIAREETKRITKEMVLKMYKILTKAKYDRDWSVKAQDCKAIINKTTFGKNMLRDLANAFQSNGIKIFVTFVEDEHDRRTWKLRVNNNPGDLMGQLAEYARRTYDLRLVDENKPKSAALGLSGIKKFVRVAPKKVKAELSEKMKYILFVMAGMLYKTGKAVQLSDLCSILRGNRYHCLEVTPNEILEIVRTYPEYFEQGFQNRNTFCFSKRGEEVWKELKELNPANEAWNIPWIINSGLKLEDVREFFPASYQVRADVETGSTVIVVVADKSIRSKMQLGRLQQRMRDCDFPIASEELVQRLKDEVEVQNALFRAYMLDKSKQPDWTTTRSNGGDSTTEKDKFLFQLEEECD